MDTWTNEIMNSRCWGENMVIYYKQAVHDDKMLGQLDFKNIPKYI